MSGQPGRAAGDGPTVVSGNLQVPVAEFVEGLAPAAVAAIEGQGADPVRVPALGGVIRGNRQRRAEVDRTVRSVESRTRAQWGHGSPLRNAGANRGESGR